MLKFKRMLVLFMLVACIAGTVYAAESEEISISDVGSTAYKSGGKVEKTNKYNHADVTLTAGPLYGQTTVYAYVSKYGSATALKTETATYNLTCTKSLVYDTDSFNYDDYKGNYFRLNVKIAPYGYQTTTKVKGTYIP